MISKTDALKLAISANLEHTHNTEGQSESDVNKLIESSKKIEEYINGEDKNENV